jgi:uroporphyrinogen-III synthase
MTAAMRVIVTRPEPECSRWVEAMRLEGLSAVALPLIEIASIPFVFDTTQSYDAFVFVSRSAVDGFFKVAKKEALQAKRCLVSGLGTRAALIQYGLQADLIDAPDSHSNQFDSEALWAVSSKRDWQGKRVLVVRGANNLGEQEGRPWLADQLTLAGALVDFVATYERRLPNLTDEQRYLLQATPDKASTSAKQDIWLFSSSQSIAHLKLLIPSRDWKTSRAIATHDRIFISAMGAGFGDVKVTRPVLADVIATLKAL